jgi:hypothetical protein
MPSASRVDVCCVVGDRDGQGVRVYRTRGGVVDNIASMHLSCFSFLKSAHVVVSGGIMLFSFLKSVHVVVLVASCLRPSLGLLQVTLVSSAVDLVSMGPGEVCVGRIVVGCALVGLVVGLVVPLSVASSTFRVVILACAVDYLVVVSASSRIILLMVWVNLAMVEQLVVVVVARLASLFVVSSWSSMTASLAWW